MAVACAASNPRLEALHVGLVDDVANTGDGGGDGFGVVGVFKVGHGAAQVHDAALHQDFQDEESVVLASSRSSRRTASASASSPRSRSSTEGSTVSPVSEVGAKPPSTSTSPAAFLPSTGSVGAK